LFKPLLPPCPIKAIPALLVGDPVHLTHASAVNGGLIVINGEVWGIIRKFSLALPATEPLKKFTAVSPLFKQFVKAPA